MAIAQLSIDLVAKMATFERDLKRTAQLTQQQTNLMSGALNGVQGAMKGLAGAFTVGFMVDFVKRSIDSVDALNDIRDATGASIENISALEDIAARTGTTMDTVSTAMVKFNGILKDVKPGSDSEKAFKALNLDVAELKRLDPAEALLKVATAFSTFADDGNKARIMQELFGKSLKDVAPFLKDLAEKGELVAKVTTAQAEEAEKFNKELFAMQKNIQDLTREISGPLVSAFNSFIEKQRTAKKEGKFGMFTSMQDMGEAVRSKNLTGSWGDAAGNAGRGWNNPENVKPQIPGLPDTPTKTGGSSKVAKKTQEQIDKEKALAAAIRDKSAAEEEFFAKVIKASDQYDSLLNRLLAATPIKQLESQRADMLMLAKELEQGRISEELYLEAVTARLDLTAEKINTVADKTDKAKTAADEFGMSMASAFEDAILNGKDFGAVLDGLAQDILQMSIRKAVTDPMSSFISGAIASVLPGFAVGTDYVPRDMVAMIHKGEKIIPAAQNNGKSTSQAIVVNQSFVVGDVASVSMVRQAVAGSERRIASGIGRSMSYGGALS
jgi:hypothetical protein